MQIHPLNRPDESRAGNAEASSLHWLQILRGRWLIAAPSLLAPGGLRSRRRGVASVPYNPSILADAPMQAALFQTRAVFALAPHAAMKT